MRTLAAALAAALLLAGCASAPSASAPAAQRDEAALDDEWGRAVSELESARGQLLAAPPGTECPEVCRLTDLICGAADRICAIAARRPQQEFGLRCQSASEDCRGARQQCEGCKAPPCSPVIPETEP